MPGYTIQATCELPFQETVAAVRAELGKFGFGVITEIDLRATLRQKIGAEIPDEVILGACNPRFAHRAIGPDQPPDRLGGPRRSPLGHDDAVDGDVVREAVNGERPSGGLLPGYGQRVAGG